MSVPRPQPLREPLVLTTRKHRAIATEVCWEAPSPGLIAQAASFKSQYPRASHRPTEASARYNCHGLTFAARRSMVWETTEIQKTLQDDDYILVDRKDVLAGDIVLYTADGDIEHSGIVVEVREYEVKVLSKWGSAHEVVHLLNECPYSTEALVFYRVVR